MPRRPDTRSRRTIPPPRPDDQTAVRGDGMPARDEAELTGVVGDASVTSGQSRSGEDTRRRGWFWHWNSIVTQFAPLIGLKGVGLLNSYTVWTDRREESPHRGFAFPSQQSEADFYGEDRNELITINKILVALDLIEIRKEMVYRTDEKGRRWKVPHNLYRVKDHGDEYILTSADVMRVVALADRDRAVYRYVRRIFSSRFAPIDRDNVWHQILEELRPTDVWQRLAARTERDEQRASARTKAGHASRRASDTTAAFSLPNGGDSTTDEATAPDTENDSTTDDTNASAEMPETVAARSNTGLATDAASANTGLGPISRSTADGANRGRATSVGPTSTTYYQGHTTTTKGRADDRSHESPQLSPARMPTNEAGLVIPAPDDQRDEEIAIRLFEEANGRPSTPAARRHLRQIAADFAATAQRAGCSGWELIGRAIDEAVASGSAFVAPKRVREIVARWERDGVPGERDNEAVMRAAAAPAVVTAVTGQADTSHGLIRAGGAIDLPNGQDPERAWEATCQLLAGTLAAQAVDALRVDAAIVGYDAGEVVIEAASEELAGRLADAWRDIVRRKLGVVLRRPVRIRVVVAEGPDDPGDATPAPERPAARPGRVVVPPPVARTAPVFSLPECGMTSEQVWTAVLDDLRGSGAIPRGEVDTWLRDTMLIGRDADGGLVIGVPHALAERRAARFRSAIAQAAAHIVGIDCGVTIVRTQAWLAARDDATGTEG